MSFGYPQALWLLGLGLPILAFHFYRGRLRRLLVPTLVLWDRLLEEEERRTALRRLRRWASLAANLGALLLLVLAAAGPRTGDPGRSLRRWAVVLDGTASMGAREPDGRTRLDHAVDRAREFVRSRGPSDRAAVFDLGGPVLPYGDDLPRLARSIEAPPPAAGTAADLRAAVEAILAAGDDVTAVLFTDRPPAGLEDLVEGGRLAWVRVGTPRENSGWVSGTAVRRPGERQVVLYLEAASFSEVAAERSEVLFLNGREVARRPLKLEAGERRSVEWILDPGRFPGAGLEEGARAEVVLEPRDDFPPDDAASFVLPPLAVPRTIVFHAGRPDEFLMEALQALAARGFLRPPEVAPVARHEALRDFLGEGVLSIFDRCAPTAVPPRGAVLRIGAGGGREVENLSIVDWDREAPPNRLVDYSAVALRRARILEGRPLLRSAEGTVAAWSAGGGRAEVELGFRLEDTDLKLLPSFVMMLQNFAGWASFEGLRSFRPAYRVGEPVRPAEALWVEEGELGFEGGGTDLRVRVHRGRLETAPRFGPGFVRAAAGGREEWIAVNLFDPAESDLRDAGGDGPDRPLPPPGPGPGRLPLVLAAAALAALLAEWWLYHRGWI